MYVGMGQIDSSGYGLDTSGVPVTGSTTSIPVSSLPVASPQDLATTQAMLNAEGTAAIATAQGSTNWALIAAGGLFLVLFIPLAMSGRR